MPIKRFGFHSGSRTSEQQRAYTTWSFRIRERKEWLVHLVFKAGELLFKAWAGMSNDLSFVLEFERVFRA